MAQQERSGLNEAAEVSAHAAGAVRGAIKTGKAVSDAAAGPYGAAAAALWTHRKAVVAIIAGLLAIPVLFIMLLPSLIFGGLTQAGSEGNPDSPILNDNAAIVENINQISQAISDLLEEGQEDVRARVDADFTASGADQKEIINPYESSPAYNANRFIAMYCAAKDQDYASISLKDMEALIRKAKVTHVYKGIVYIRLSNGANAIAHSCYDRRRPGRKDDVSFVVTHLDEERGVAAGIITRIIKQHI